ncbi:hypothetical protein AB0H73_22315 [Streptomyces olivoreticuli]|uniref:hypothetical protein n=1 Tax=Streptomyces olivoreticuli TaxID=68246 RepID=UPI000E22B823|nr:hypothetical protein [Streptomyces olivoreticuli]
MAYATGPACGPGWGAGGGEETGGGLVGGCGAVLLGGCGGAWVGGVVLPCVGPVPEPCPAGGFGLDPGLPGFAAPGDASAWSSEGEADGAPADAPLAAGLPLAPRAAFASVRPGLLPGIRTPPSGSGRASRCLPAPDDEAGFSGSLTLMHPPRARAATATAAIRVAAV